MTNQYTPDELRFLQAVMKNLTPEDIAYIENPPSEDEPKASDQEVWNFAKEVMKRFQGLKGQLFDDIREVILKELGDKK